MDRKEVNLYAYIGQRVDKHVQNNVVLQYENTELGVCHVRYLTDMYKKLPEAVAKEDML